MAALPTQIGPLGLRTWRQDNQGNFLLCTSVQHQASVRSTKASEMQEFDLPLGGSVPPKPAEKRAPFHGPTADIIPAT
jgi:hypothetical protein